MDREGRIYLSAHPRTGGHSVLIVGADGRSPRIYDAPGYLFQTMTSTDGGRRIVASAHSNIPGRPGRLYVYDPLAREGAVWSYWEPWVGAQLRHTPGLILGAEGDSVVGISRRETEILLYLVNVVTRQKAECILARESADLAAYPEEFGDRPSRIYDTGDRIRRGPDRWFWTYLKPLSDRRNLLFRFRPSSFDPIEGVRWTVEFMAWVPSEEGRDDFDVSDFDFVGSDVYYAGERDLRVSRNLVPPT